MKIKILGMLALLTGATLSAYTDRIQIDDISYLGFDGIGITNRFCLDAITRLGTYDDLVASYGAGKKLIAAQSELIKNLALSLTNSDKEVFATWIELQNERKAAAAKAIKNRWTFFAIGGGCGIVLTAVVIALVRGVVK